MTRSKPFGCFGSAVAQSCMSAATAAQPRRQRRRQRLASRPGSEASSYSQHKEPVLNMNWLEEVARKVRAAALPVLQTVKSLKLAMEQQH